MLPEHARNPEIWFRQSQSVSLPMLVTAFRSELITATVRLGVRDKIHEKGYFPGQVVTLRILDGDDNELWSGCVRVTAIRVRRLEHLTREDLRPTIIYAEEGWLAVQRDLSLFAGETIDPIELVSIVEFEYGVFDKPIWARWITANDG